MLAAVIGAAFGIVQMIVLAPYIARIAFSVRAAGDLHA